MIDLGVQFGGLLFKNPFLVGACPSTRDADHILEAAHSGWAGAVTKTVSAHPPFLKNPTPSLAQLISANGAFVGLASNEIYTDVLLKAWCDDELPKIKKTAPPDFHVIASIMEGPNPEHWRTTAQQLAAAGADMIEMNVSCPHGMSEYYMGRHIQDDLNLLGLVVNSCSRDLAIPVIVKVNAVALDIGAVARTCAEAGASGISAINTLSSVIGVDIETLRPLPTCEGYSTIAGYCGPAIRPVALRCVSEISRASDVPVSGVGGIEDYRSALEFILLGASTVQIATSVMMGGYGIIGGLRAGISEYLSRKGYASIEDVRGKSLPYLVSSKEIEQITHNRIASVDESKCTLCDECIEPCKAGATEALSMIDRKLVVDSSKCIGCGLCLAVCRFEALQMVVR